MYLFDTHNSTVLPFEEAGQNKTDPGLNAFGPWERQRQHQKEVRFMFVLIGPDHESRTVGELD